MEERLLITIEQNINRLTRDPRCAVRYAAPEWVDMRLCEELERRLTELLEVSEACWRRFGEGQEPEFSLVSDKLLHTLALSAQKKREFRYLSADNPGAAAEWLMDQQRAKERIAFRKKAGIPPATWKRFWEASTYTSEDTVERIVQALSLAEEEEKEFRSLIVHEFMEAEPFKQEVWRRVEECTGITEFLEHAFISQNAWEPFRRNSEGSVTSQGTLLKMVIGFAMSPEEGWTFLESGGSGFVMPRDLVVLACMHCGIYDVYVLSAALDWYAAGYGGGRLFGNLYRNL